MGLAMMGRQATGGARQAMRLFVYLLAVWMLSGSPAWAQRGMGGGRHSQNDDDSKEDRNPPPATRFILTPHGGQYLTTESNHFEVVYMPLQTRIYGYSKGLKPVSVRDVRVMMSLQLPSESATRQIPLQYVAAPAASEQDYLAAAFDLGLLQDKETPITFEFSNLPDHHYPTASFSPLFTKSQIRPLVAQVQVLESDRDAITRQGVCPVDGIPLGGKGQVVKLFIAEFPMYVCCPDCLLAVKQHPEKYDPRLPHPSGPAGPPGLGR
jgi:hypothetical protein